MTALALLNVGLQTLLLGTAGCLLVCLFLNEARHRAWASLLSLAAMVLMPWIPFWQGTHSAWEAQEPTMWRPEWKITLSDPTPAALLVMSQDAEMTMEPAIGSFPHWTGILVWIWCGGSAWITLRLLWRTAAIRRWKQRLPLHERECLQVRVAQDLASPCLAGVITPEIVVPERALQEWSAQQWRWALTHEREHRRGGDPLIAWCLEWVRASLWWNPLVHRLIADWEQAREEICDRAAVDISDEAAPYSEFLLSVAAAARSPGMAMAVSRPARRLKARLISLLEHRSVRRRPHWTFLLLAAGMSVLAFNLVGCVSLEQTTKPKEEGPLMTRSFKITPDVVSLIRGVVPTHPIATNQGVRLGAALSAQQGLQKFGVDFPIGASAEFDLARSQLIVKNNVRRLQQVETLLNALTVKVDFQNVMININSKWIEIPSDALVLSDLSVLTESQFQMALRSLNQRKGVDLLTAPQITQFSGQRATVEVIREHPSRDGLDFRGVRNEFTPIIHEGKILLNFGADIGTPFHGGKRIRLMEHSLPEATTIKHLIRRESVAVGNGETLAVHMGELSKGRRTMLFLTANLIDRSGKKWSMEEAMKKRVNGSPASDE